MATNSLVLVHGCHWAQVASGAARRANVLLFPASSSFRLCFVDATSINS